MDRGLGFFYAENVICSLQGKDNIMKQKKKINPHLFTFSFWSGVTAIGFVLVIDRVVLLEGMALWMAVGMLLVGMAATIYAEIYFLISLYRCWSILQGSTARTTPVKAVVFLFIPIFNIYWIFVAIRGLAKDANTFLSQKNINENKISVGLSLAACILGIIPYVNTLFPILQNILIYQWAKFFNYSITNLGVEYR